LYLQEANSRFIDRILAILRETSKKSSYPSKNQAPSKSPTSDHE
jgi:hypothetical protein